MKILIVSDTHRYHKNLENVLNQIGPIDMLIHLGDAEGAEDYIEAIAECPVEIVAGNNDFFSLLEREKTLRIGKYNILLTHGHNYYVSSGKEYLVDQAKKRGYQIVMFGHTHLPLVYHADDVTLVNPGSISYPRQDGRIPTYIIMDIDRFGEAHFTVNYFQD